MALSISLRSACQATLPVVFTTPTMATSIGLAILSVALLLALGLPTALTLGVLAAMSASAPPLPATNFPSPALATSMAAPSPQHHSLPHRQLPHRQLQAVWRSKLPDLFMIIRPTMWVLVLRVQKRSWKYQVVELDLILEMIML